MAALLTSEKTTGIKSSSTLPAARIWGYVSCRPILTNLKGISAFPEGQVRFGLSAVKNVGVGAIDTVIEPGKILGKFSSLIISASMWTCGRLTKGFIESLIKCGAFDAMDYKRRPLMYLTRKSWNWRSGAIGKKAAASPASLINSKRTKMLIRKSPIRPCCPIFRNGNTGTSCQ